MRYSTLAVTASLAAGVLGQRSVPANVKSLYNEIKGKGCSDFLSKGYYSEEGGSKDFGYCGDHLKDDGIVYITGSKGKFANMDVDCDGAQHGAGDDGRCGSSGDTQSQTTWQDEVKKLSGGKVKDLNAFVHTYVVFGNDDTKPAFDPRHYGIEPLSLMAVVCGDKLVYGVWGDTNGNDGPPLVGEAAISTGTLCYGKGINGNSGHDQDDVLYIAFTGQNAVPKDAAWTAKSAADFEKSLQTLGDSLVGKIGGGAANGPANSTTTTEGDEPTTTEGDEPTSTAKSATSKPATSGKGGKATPPAATAAPSDDGDDGSDDGDDGNSDDGNSDSGDQPKDQKATGGDKDTEDCDDDDSQ